MTNSQSRLISSIVLILGVLFVFFLGKMAAKITFFVMFAIVLDEILVNFKHKKRSEVDYLISFAGYIIGAFFIISASLNSYILYSNLIYVLLTLLSLSIFSNNIFFLIRNSKLFLSIIRYSLFLLPLFPLLAFCYIIDYENWRLYLALVLSIGAISDSLGWIVGKYWGKHKLYPKVSPNKTIEGALGAVAGCGLVISSYLYITAEKSPVALFIVFSFLAAIGVLGDLWQSRLKRLFKLKDSSKLIPGHGGVYDRLDSHIFIVPFFLQILLIFPHFL